MSAAVVGAVVAALAVFAVLGGRGDGSGDRRTPIDTPSASESSPTAKPTVRPAGQRRRKPTPGLVYYAGHRARTGELLLFAERVPDTGKTSMLGVVRAATAGTAHDPDYGSLWRDITVDKVALHWDGDEGFYDVQFADDTPTRRPPGMSMREAHLAIQQVVWTLQSAGEVEAPVKFSVGDATGPVTDLLGVPATGPDDAYLAADYRGVLSAVNILTVEDTAATDGKVDVSGLAESFEGTVGVRVLGPTGEIVVEDSTQAPGCFCRLSPWSYTLDASDWLPGVYTLKALTDDAVGIAQGSDGPEVDTKTITID